MKRPSVAMELAALGLVHTAAAAVLCNRAGQPLWGKLGAVHPQLSTRDARVTLAAAVALYVMARRWQPASRQIIAAVLITKLIPFFEGDRRNHRWVAAIFLPVAAEMWIRWPHAAAGTISTVHGNFTGTMAQLCGLGSKEATTAFAKDPVGVGGKWGAAELLQTSKRSVAWSARALGTVYLLQALFAWFQRKPGKDGKQPPTFADRLLNAGICTLRTVAIYTALSQYSVWAYARNGHLRSRLWSLPSAFFLLEPLGRAITLCEYYVAHYVYFLIGTARNALGRGDAFPAALPAAALAAYAVAGRRPPLHAALRAIADKVAPDPGRRLGGSQPRAAGGRPRSD